MSTSNHERVGKALGWLRDGLRPFIEREFKAQFGKGWAEQIQDILADTRLRSEKADATYDVAALLVIMDRSWGEVFRPRFGRAERSLVNELIDIRNRWAHQGHFSADDAYRALDTSGRLLAAISAPEANDVETMKKALRRLHLDEEEAGGEIQQPVADVNQSEATENFRPRHEKIDSQSPTQPIETSSKRTDRRDIGQADRIRQFVIDRLVAPARAAGHKELTIRVGDIHKAMGLSSAMPAVCSAIGSRKFNDVAGVKVIERKGPPNGANVYFRFGLSAPPSSERLTASVPAPMPEPAAPRASSTLDLSDALVLISCVKSKLPHAAPARELYTSPLFRKARNLVEASGARWLLLSSQYGLVDPGEVIAPYDYTLNTLGVAVRKAWAAKVLERLLPATANYRRVVFLAGARYREFLIEPLRRHGLVVEAPMEHLTRGEQLAWLSEEE